MKKNKFNGQFLAFPFWCLEYTGTDHIANTVLLHALRYMDNETQQITTSYDHLAKLAGVSRSTVIRAMNRLIATGVIYKRRRRGTKGNSQTNVYTVNFNNPKAQIEGGVTGDTRGGVTADTLGVALVTPSGGSTGDTQSRKTNHKPEGTKRKNEKEISFIIGDPKWQRQFGMLNSRENSDEETDALDVGV